MDRTQATIRKLLAALPAPGYDLGILGERGMYRLEAVPPSRILRMLPTSGIGTPAALTFTSDPPEKAPTRCWTTSPGARSPGSTPKATTPQPSCEQAPATSRPGCATSSHSPKNLAPLRQRPLRPGSARMEPPPIGGDSDASPASPTASLSTATLGASTPSSVSSVTPASLSPPPQLSAPGSSAYSSRSSRNALRSASATPPLFHASPCPYPWPRFARRRATAAGQPPPIWRSRSPPTPRAGPKPTSPPPSPAITSARTRTRLGKPPTSGAPSPKPVVGSLTAPGELTRHAR